MLVLVADAVSPAALDRIRGAGHEVVEDAALKDDALRDALAERDPAVLVVRSTKVRAEHLDAAPGLELVVRAGAGVDSIDVEGAAARGVFVANCPGKNAAAVAELAFGLLLSMDRRIPDNVAEARAGRWAKKEFSRARGVKGRTLGLVGLGAIGREMARRARAFDMDVVAWTPSLTDEEAAESGAERAESARAVAARADVLSVHVPSTPETAGLVGEELLEALPPRAFVINTSRADVMDEDAVARALDARPGLRVATDVPRGEPQVKAGDLEHPLAGHPRFYITHHIGASTDEATEAIGREAARVVLAYAETGRPPNAVNLAEGTDATHLLTVRHADRVGVLAAVLGVVSEAGWNVQEMENLLFEGERGAACARVRFAGEPTEEALGRIRGLDHVIHAAALAL